MRGSRIAIRAAIVCSAASVGFALWSSATDDPAYAADHHPTSVKDGIAAAVQTADRLPEQAAARAHEVVDQVPAGDQPSTIPAPETTSAPQLADEPAQEPAEPPAADTPADPTGPADEPTPQPRPGTGDPAPAEPAPAPAPTTPVCELGLVGGLCDVLDDVLPAPVPNPVGPIVVPKPVDDVVDQVVDVLLPGPTPEVAVPAVPMDLPLQLPVIDRTGTGPADPHPAATAEPIPVEDCWQPPGRDRADHRVHDGLNPRPHAAHARAHRGCPDTPSQPAPHIDCVPAATGSTSNAAHQLAADLAGGLAVPTVARLEQARPRSQLPTSRHVSIEPGPA